MRTSLFFPKVVGGKKDFPMRKVVTLPWLYCQRPCVDEYMWGYRKEVCHLIPSDPICNLLNRHLSSAFCWYYRWKTFFFIPWNILCEIVFAWLSELDGKKPSFEFNVADIILFLHKQTEGKCSVVIVVLWIFSQIVTIPPLNLINFENFSNSKSASSNSLRDFNDGLDNSRTMPAIFKRLHWIRSIQNIWCGKTLPPTNLF